MKLEDRKLFGVPEVRKDYFGRWEPMKPDPSKHTKQKGGIAEDRTHYPKSPGPMKEEGDERPAENEDWISKVMRIGFGIKF